MKSGRRVVVFGSVADHGTRSISEAFVRALEPVKVLHLDFGLKRMGLVRLIKAIGFVFSNRKKEVSMICLHRAPLLIAGLLPFPRKARWVGIIDSNETFPFGLRGFFGFCYDWLYRLAFHRLDAVYTPWKAFADYYGCQGSRLLPCDYPLPFPGHPSKSLPVSGSIRVLFVGADYKRKGGDLLLDAWRDNPPQGASLTFVSPQAPDMEIDGVTFRRDIRSGSPQQMELFETHDLLVLPSRLEPYGFVLLEAINNGMGVITTQMAGAADLVRSFGGFVTATPEEAVAECLRLASSPKEIEALKQQCLDYLPTYLQRVDCFLQEMINGPAN